MNNFELFEESPQETNSEQIYLFSMILILVGQNNYNSWLLSH